MFCFDSQGGRMTDYRARIERVMDAIRSDPAADRSLDSLADIACLSRFHFARVFRAMTGEAPAEAVRRLRLNHAAVLLVATALPVEAVALRCGFGHPDSFHRAFRAAFGATARQIRDRGGVPPPLLPQNQGDLPMFDVTIRAEPETVAAALMHRGAYPRIGETFARLDGLLREQGLIPRTGPAVAVYYDDPSAVPVDELRAHAGMSVPASLTLPAVLDRLVLPAGRSAVLVLKGPYSGLPAAWAYLYREWLPRSGEALADRAPWERYLNMPGEVPDSALLTEILVPLE
jgi:AraC family transcriptional regulator